MTKDEEKEFIEQCPEVRRGRLMAFRGNWMSGIGFLVIMDDDRGMIEVPCENAPTVRALEGAFGNVIGDGHMVKARPGFIGRRVYYSMDDMGLVLEGFTPASEASKLLVKVFRMQRRKRAGEL